MARKDFPITVELTAPIVVKKKSGEDEVITEFVISSSPKAKHFRGMSVSDMKFDDTLSLICKVCNQPRYIVDELEAEDMMAVSEVITDFLPGSGQQTGK